MRVQEFLSKQINVKSPCVIQQKGMYHSRHCSEGENIIFFTHFAATNHAKSDFENVTFEDHFLHVDALLGVDCLTRLIGSSTQHFTQLLQCGTVA